MSAQLRVHLKGWPEEVDADLSPVVYRCKSVEEALAYGSFLLQTGMPPERSVDVKGRHLLFPPHQVLLLEVVDETQ